MLWDTWRGREPAHFQSSRDAIHCLQLRQSLFSKAFRSMKRKHILSTFPNQSYNNFKPRQDLRPDTDLSRKKNLCLEEHKSNVILKELKKELVDFRNYICSWQFSQGDKQQHSTFSSKETLEVLVCENNYCSKPVIFKEKQEIYKHILATKIAVLKIPHLL